MVNSFSNNILKQNASISGVEERGIIICKKEKKMEKIQIKEYGKQLRNKKKVKTKIKAEHINGKQRSLA